MTLYIERLDTDGEPPVPLTAASMVAGLKRTSQSMYDRTASWIAIADRMWSLVPNNSIFNMRVTPGGLVGQYSAFGNFKLAPDETMLIEFGDTGAPYMGIQLGNRWFVSMDYENHTSTLNMTQLGCREDESRCYALISLEDPVLQTGLIRQATMRGSFSCDGRVLNHHPREQISHGRASCPLKS